ncbi:hypothetical protein BD410DRAFT_795083 [Rickenella mellea]|uniref:Uncharacterized protein n=1 Tax=Rickenella mellea TaxID=50990 RepID=A0A4Y7PNI8_9AGAM|nr:hypothetical protein BD410DRAFT_795083 [Rickenella mellea]
MHVTPDVSSRTCKSATTSLVLNHHHLLYLLCPLPSALCPLPVCPLSVCPLSLSSVRSRPVIHRRRQRSECSRCDSDASSYYEYEAIPTPSPHTRDGGHTTNISNEHRLEPPIGRHDLQLFQHCDGALAQDTHPSPFSVHIMRVSEHIRPNKFAHQASWACGRDLPPHFTRST